MYLIFWCVKILYFNRKYGFLNNFELFVCIILFWNLVFIVDLCILRVFSDRSVCRRFDIDLEFDNYVMVSNIIMYLFIERNMLY